MTNTTNTAPRTETTITEARAEAIITEERMDFQAVGPVQSLVVVQQGGDWYLKDDSHEEVARLGSEAAFRRQVRAWRRAMEDE